MAPPTAIGVDGGVTPGLAVGDAWLECPGVALELGRGVPGRCVAGIAVGWGVGRTVGVGRGVAGPVTVMAPPAAVAPLDATYVTDQVPAEATRVDMVQVGPVPGARSAIERTDAPRVSLAVTALGLGLPVESTRKEKIVLVVPLRGLTDPLLRLFLASVGPTMATTAMVAISSATPELRLARRGRAHAVGADAANRISSGFVRGSLAAPGPRSQ